MLLISALLLLSCLVSGKIFTKATSTLPKAAASVSPGCAAGSGECPAAVGVELPPLPYEYNALEPYLGEQTLRVHHDKHHAKVDQLTVLECVKQHLVNELLFTI